MIRQFSIILAGALWLTGCGAPDPYADHDWPEPAPALWQVTSPDGDIGWLFGTVHSLPDSLEWQNAALDTAFAEADLLVVEIANLTDSAASAEAYDAYAYSDAASAFAERHEAGFVAQVEAITAPAGISLSQLDRLKDWAAALVIAGGIRTGEPENGVDRALIASGMPVTGLESFEIQFAAFNSLADADQADFLNAVVTREAQRDGLANLTAWLTGDVALLEAEAETGILANPAVREALLTGRNTAWMEQLLPLIDDGAEPFVAVGAGHMLGAEGLPALFTAQGYGVVRLQ